MTRRRARGALSVALVLAGLLAFMPSPGRAQSLPPLGSGATCWWTGVWSTATFPNGDLKMGCVSTSATSSADCWVNYQISTGYPNPATGMKCQPPDGNGNEACYTGGYGPPDFVCTVQPGHNCMTATAQPLDPMDENCTQTCTTGFVDYNGHCTSPPPALPKKEPLDTDCEICKTAGNNPEQPTSLAAPLVGMSVAQIFTMQVSQNISDIPVGYQPPVGPGAYLRLAYNQKDSGQPASFTYGNVGPRWTLNLTSFVSDDPANPGLTVTRYISGGGLVDYTLSNLSYDSGVGAFTPERSSDGTLYRIPATGAVTSYELRFASGAKLVYGKLDGTSAAGRRVFLTRIVDPAGKAVTLTYDASLRITKLTDAATRITTLSYTNADPLKLTRVTDPFGRHADFTYDGSGRLASITDVLGIVSSFGYSTAYNGYINTLTTPYGVTNFSYYETPASVDPNALSYQALEQTDPLGKTRRVMFRDQSTLPATPATTPTGVTVAGDYSTDNSFIWDEHAYPLAITKDGSGNVTAEDLSKAQRTHWLKNPSGQVSAAPAAMQPALEAMSFMNYPGQSYAGSTGTFATPTATGRVLDDASTQLTQATYNALGKPLTVTDPAGRVTTFAYDANNIDLLTVYQGGDLIGTYANYSSQHNPGTYTDAAGQLWQMAYNSAGQLIYATDPLNETIFREYDSVGRLTRITIPKAVAFASVVYGTTNTGVPTAVAYTYDGFDNVQTETDSEGRALTYSHDALGRITRITYPDGTHDDRDYTFQSGPNAGTQSLDLRKATDRMGRVTTYDYDADRRLTGVTEPIDSTTTRTTNYSYYENGALKDQTDAKGNVTHYAIDVQGRPTTKTYAYGTASAKTETLTYETSTSRAKSLKDALNQIKTWTYGPDDLPTAITYTASVNATPNVSFAWDTVYRRPTGMTDGTGTTSFTYIPTGTNGALQLATMDNASFANDTITDSYDALGRLSAQTISGGNESFTYDLLSRLKTHTTSLGTFTYGYLGQTSQISTRSLNGTSISSSWGYDTNANDRRLTGITNSGVTRSYGLSYVIAGGGGAIDPYAIQSITDTAAATHPWLTQTHGYGYDYAHRVLSATQTTPGTNGYAYDKLDNATTVTNPGSATVNPTYNVNNQLATWGTKTYAYDANGNTLSGDGTKTYKWDAENRLKEIDYVGGTNKTVFTYDALDHRIVTAETISGTTTTTRNLWCGARICQTRNSGNTVLARYFPEGEYVASGTKKYVYMQDQLGSVRDVIDAATGSLVASLDYGPYGTRTRTNGSVVPLYQYAGLAYHPASALMLATYRVYDGAIQRLINRDPITERGGINLYRYANVDPTNLSDIFGLQSLSLDWVPGVGFGITIGIDNNNGAFFGSIRFEWGAKGGFDYNPFGNMPGPERDCKNDPHISSGSTISAFAGVDASIFNVSGGIDTSIGAQIISGPKIGNLSNFYFVPPEPHASIVGGFGFEAGGSAGFEVSVFGDSLPKCGCTQ